MIGAKSLEEFNHIKDHRATVCILTVIDRNHGAPQDLKETLRYAVDGFNHRSLVMGYHALEVDFVGL